MNVYFALLALLVDGPRSGRRLHEELAAGPHGMHPLNARQVYPVLARLERAGLVEPSGGAGADDPQQEFRITTGGQRELAGWLRTTPTPDAQPGDELVLKIQLAGQVPGTDVHEVIQAHRRHLVELMQRRTRARRDGTGQNLGRALASYAELFRLDSVIRWLDAAEGLLATDPACRTAGRPPTDQIWASDADRERVVASLRDHFAEGRAECAELDERLTVALSARTAGELGADGRPAITPGRGEAVPLAEAFLLRGALPGSRRCPGAGSIPSCRVTANFVRVVRQAGLLCHADLPRGGDVSRCFLEEQEPGDVHAGEHQDGQ